MKTRSLRITLEGVNRVIQINWSKMWKIKIDNTQLFFNEVSLSSRLSPHLEFTNYRINHLVLIGIHNPRVHLLFSAIPKLTSQLAWLCWHFNFKNPTKKLLWTIQLKQYYKLKLKMIFSGEKSCKYVLFSVCFSAALRLS